MSGEKRTYVSIESRQQRRIRELESSLSAFNSNLVNDLSAIRREAQQEMKNRLRPLEERQRRQEGVVKSLKSDLSRVEKDTQKRLNQQRKEFANRLDAQRGEYRKMIAEQDQKIDRVIEAERKNRQQAVQNLQGQIDAIVADANRKGDTAHSFVADLSKIVEEVNALPHDRFALGQLDALRRHVSDAQQSANAGMPEAALSTAQRTYWDVADLRVHVLAKEREFLLLHEAALEEARSLLAEARSNRQYKLELGKGQDRDEIDLEVDYWSHGELTQLENDISSLEKQLIDGESTLTSDQVRDIFSQLDALKPRMTQVVEHARDNILASQLRVNIADAAVEAFKSQGFAVADETYEGEDERNAYYVKLQNIAGSEVVTVISPVEGEFGKNEVAVHSYDETFVDDAVLRQRSEEMVSLMNEEGLRAEAPRHVGNANPECQNFEEIRKKMPASSIRKVSENSP